MEINLHPHHLRSPRISQILSIIHPDQKSIIFNIMPYFEHIILKITKNGKIYQLYLLNSRESNFNIKKRIIFQIKHLASLKRLILKGLSTLSLEFLPSSLEELFIVDHKFTTWPRFPSKLSNLIGLSITEGIFSKFTPIAIDLPNLQFLSLANNQISSLRGFPTNLPNLQYIDFSYNYIKNFDDFSFPPKLSDLKVIQNKIVNFVGLTSFIQKLNRHFSRKLILTGNPLCSLFGCPKVKSKWAVNLILQNQTYFPNSIPQSYKNYLDLNKRSLEEIFNYFQINPNQLAQAYGHKSTLTDFEQDRIIYEGNFTTFIILIKNCNPNDPILKKLGQRLDIPIFLGDYLK